MKAGEVLTEQNLRAIRPGWGLPTKHMDQLLGKKVKYDVKKGTPASWEIIL
ncbi:Pseudaminic acid synthase [compost metagenome]